MTTNTSSEIRICTNRYHANRSELLCSWNVSFSDLGKIISEGYNISSWIPSAWVPCPSNVICYPDLNPADKISMYFLNNGKISMNELIINDHLDCRLSAEKYCFVYSAPENETERLLTACKSLFEWLINTTHHNSVLNVNTVGETAYDTFMLFNIILMCLSFPFFVATFVIYTILPDLNNFHGLILRIYTTCNFVEFLFNAVIFLKLNTDCYSFIAIADHFTFLSMYLWLNVMSFDIWWTFRSLKTHRKTFSKKKFIIYSIYVWGTSMLIVVIGAILQFVPNLPEGLIKPQYSCIRDMGDERSFVVYYEVPVGATLLINACFFVSTAISIFRQKNDTAKQLKGNDSGQHNNEKNRFCLYLKLFLVMGVQWFTGMVDIIRGEAPLSAISYILELPNVLQGVIIFIVFAWNDRIKRLLSTRLGFKDRTVPQRIEVAALRISPPVRQG